MVEDVNAGDEEAENFSDEESLDEGADNIVHQLLDDFIVAKDHQKDQAIKAIEQTFIEEGYMTEQEKKKIASSFYNQLPSFESSRITKNESAYS